MEIKSCPFCNGNGILHSNVNQEIWIECDKCGCKIPKVLFLKHIVIDNWNMRFHEWHSTNFSQLPPFTSTENHYSVHSDELLLQTEHGDYVLGYYRKTKPDYFKDYLWYGSGFYSSYDDTYLEVKAWSFLPEAYTGK